MLKSLSWKSKKLCYKDYFEKCSSNSKRLWAGINTILNKRKNDLDDEIFLNDNGQLITKKTVANRFNNYFINVAKNLMQKHGKSNNGFQDYLKNPNVNSLFLNENDPGKVYNLLTKLMSGKHLTHMESLLNLLKLQSHSLQYHQQKFLISHSVQYQYLNIIS